MLIYTVDEKHNLNTGAIDTTNIQDYFQTKYDVLHFVTNEGIFEIINNKMYKVKVNNTRETYQLDDKTCFSIQPEDNFRSEIFYIPINYKYVKNVLKKYKLSPDSLLTLVLVNNKQIYFETLENEITNSIKEDLITFLSLVKLYT
jgi:hypothetical protein